MGKVINTSEAASFIGAVCQLTEVESPLRWAVQPWTQVYFYTRNRTPPCIVYSGLNANAEILVDTKIPNHRSRRHVRIGKFKRKTTADRKAIQALAIETFSGIPADDRVSRRSIPAVRESGETAGKHAVKSILQHISVDFSRRVGLGDIGGGADEIALRGVSSMLPFGRNRPMPSASVEEAPRVENVEQDLDEPVRATTFSTASNRGVASADTFAKLARRLSQRVDLVDRIIVDIDEKVRASASDSQRVLRQEAPQGAVLIRPRAS